MIADSSQEPTTSDWDQPMMVVNSQDELLGIRDRRTCHAGQGILHRAISVFVLNSRGHVLVQQRHAGKALWGGSWSNTCCTHPTPGESPEEAAKRRLQEEMGVSAPLRFAFKFEYHAQFDENWSERELCSVYVGRSDCDPSPDPSEVQAARWMSVCEIEEMFSTKKDFTPWFKMEWELLTTEHPQLITEFAE